jgi:hypothetical protein
VLHFLLLLVAYYRTDVVVSDVVQMTLRANWSLVSLRQHPFLCNVPQPFFMKQKQTNKKQ